MSEFIVKKLNYLFDVFDANGNGAVSADDFARVIENYHTLGAMETGTEESGAFTAHILSWWQALSTDFGGAETIGRDEFVAFFQKVAAMPDRIKLDGQVVFNVLDTDGDGAISATEYAGFLTVYGLDTSASGEHFAVLDTNGDGQVTRDEFADDLVEFITSDDPEAPGNVLFGDVDEGVTQ